MASIQASDSKASFVYVGGVNEHQGWLNSVSPTNQHGRAALDFSNLSGCEQIAQNPTHVPGNCLDLLTDAPSPVTVQVVPPIGSTDHCGLSFNIQTLFSIPDEPISRKVSLKSRANWAGVIADFNNIVWREAFQAVSPIEAHNNELYATSERKILSRAVRSRRKDKVWFNDDCKHAQREKQIAYCEWSRLHSHESWENYVRLRSVGQRTYSSAQVEYNKHLKNVLIVTSQSHSWWSALKQSFFGVD